MRLKNKVAIVTGSTAGIGRGIATVFAREGASVVVSGRSMERGREIAEEIKAAGGEVLFVPADIAEVTDVHNLIQKTIEYYGRLNILVNNVGTSDVRKPALDTTVEEWDRVMDVNLRGSFLACKFAIVEMLKNSGGVVINIGSVVTRTGAYRFAAYAASKGGLIQLTKSLAQDYSPRGIRINLISLGPFDTEGSAALFPDRQAWRRSASRTTLLGRVGLPEDAAYAALYLASDEASFVTGACLEVDGGVPCPPQMSSFFRE